MLPGGPPPAARRHTLVDDRLGESALGSTARVPCSGPSLRSLQTIPRALRLNAPPVWLEAEGARRSAATIGSMTAAATASSSESSDQLALAAGLQEQALGRRQRALETLSRKLAVGRPVAARRDHELVRPETPMMPIRSGDMRSDTGVELVHQPSDGAA